jgi:glycerol-3-phosphate dehydrogenase
VKRELEALEAREWDVLVVGGGIHGAAAAWDAAQRGMAVALVEREDFGAGTSWNSLKTIHGGMRHLQRLDLGSLRESARERSTLLRIAAPLVAPLGFFVPCSGHGARGRAAFAVALALQDALTRDRNRGLPPERSIPDGRTVGAAEALRLVPGLEPRGLTGAALWHDAQVLSSERLLLAFVHAAADAGAGVANHAEALELLRANGRVAGAAIRDALSGRTLELRARIVVNAAGPWADALDATAVAGRARLPMLRARNLVLRRPSGLPFAVGSRSGGRFLFLVPWQGRAIVGTAYEGADQAASDPRLFLEDATRAFPWAGIEADDLLLVHEGLVPGERDASGLYTRGRIVDHEAEGRAPGLLTLQPVKYTTARAFAEQAVDRVERRLARPAVACRTALTRLAKAEAPSGTLEERARRAVRDEMAATLADAVLRRLDLGSAGPPRADDLARVARAMAQELGWDAARERSERAAIAAFFARRAGAGGLLE